MAGSIHSAGGPDANLSTPASSPKEWTKGKLTAEYRNGVREVTAPISAAALPRKIEVKSLPSAKGAGA